MRGESWCADNLLFCSRSEHEVRIWQTVFVHAGPLAQVQDTRESLGTENSNDMTYEAACVGPY